MRYSYSTSQAYFMEKPQDQRLRKLFAHIYHLPQTNQRLGEINDLETAISKAWMENTVSAEMRATLLESCDLYRQRLETVLQCKTTTSLS